jgi:DNA mismatch endonuclease (patch repair protein)
MVDRLSTERRSWLMAQVKGRNTLPEMIVRRMAHSLGYRFRLHRRELPGSPDLVFPRRKAVIFVHGCFWHRHGGCRKATSPKSREDFWNEKFERNVARDKRVKSELERMGWKVLVVWECETRDAEKLALDLQAFL